MGLTRRCSARAVAGCPRPGRSTAQRRADLGGTLRPRPRRSRAPWGYFVSRLRHWRSQHARRFAQRAQMRTTDRRPSSSSVERRGHVTLVGLHRFSCGLSWQSCRLSLPGATSRSARVGPPTLTKGSSASEREKAECRWLDDRARARSSIADTRTLSPTISTPRARSFRQLGAAAAKLRAVFGLHSSLQVAIACTARALQCATVPAGQSGARTVQM
jgi:hypothetical protein